jgi:membrane-bound metal-dependent hydrolase YbcI (DUF457 family)
MISLLLACLALAGAATITAAFTLRGEESLQGWAVAGLAVLGNTIGFLDLATVAGVVLFGGIAGVGWRPRAYKTLLPLGLLALCIGLVPCVLAVLAVSGGTVVAGGSLTTLIPPGTQDGATRSKPEQSKPPRYAGFAIPCTPLQRITDHP